jgi:hypothetical protein
MPDDVTREGDGLPILRGTGPFYYWNLGAYECDLTPEQEAEGRAGLWRGPGAMFAAARHGLIEPRGVHKSRQTAVGARPREQRPRRSRRSAPRAGPSSSEPEPPLVRPARAGLVGVLAERTETRRRVSDDGLRLIIVVRWLDRQVSPPRWRSKNRHVKLTPGEVEYYRERGRP